MGREGGVSVSDFLKDGVTTFFSLRFPPSRDTIACGHGASISISGY